MVFERVFDTMPHELGGLYHIFLLCSLSTLCTIIYWALLTVPRLASF
jgi:hypothetical protein